MTNREFYEAVIEANVNDEITAMAQACIAKLDHTNELRRAAAAVKAEEKAAEKAPIREALVNALKDEPMTATDLIEATGLDIKPQSVPSLMKPFVEDGTVAKMEVKVPGKGKKVGYVRA